MNTGQFNSRLGLWNNFVQEGILAIFNPWLIFFIGPPKAFFLVQHKIFKFFIVFISPTKKTILLQVKADLTYTRNLSRSKIYFFTILDFLLDRTKVLLIVLIGFHRIALRKMS